MILFSDKVQAPYRVIESWTTQPSLFGSAKTAPFSTEFRDPLEPFKRKFIKMTLIELYPSFPKLFEICKSDKLWQNA